MQAQQLNINDLNKPLLVASTLNDIEFLAQNNNLLQNKEIKINGLFISEQMIPSIIKIVSKGNIKKIIYDHCQFPIEIENHFFSDGADLTITNCNITPELAYNILDLIDPLTLAFEIDLSNNQINGPDLDNFMKKLKHLIRSGISYIKILNLSGNNIPQSYISDFEDSTFPVIID